MQAGISSTKHIKQVYKAIKMFHPTVLEDIKPKLIRPEPVLTHTILLPALLTKFCELKGVSEGSVIGLHKGSEGIELKTLFVAVIINLYDPQLLTGIHSDNMRDHLSEELAGLLKTQRTFISQITENVKAFLNPYRPLPAYNDFKNEANKISKMLEKEFSK